MPRTTLAVLRSAAATWRRTQATIRYRSQRQRPGLPISAHQCLRQVFGGAIDRPTALRLCDPGGTVTLVWDPPRRWRIDVTEAGVTTTAIVVGSSGVLCLRPDGGTASCRSRPIAKLRRHIAFHELIAPVRWTMREAGIAPEGPITVSEGVVAGSPVRCIDRRSGSSSVRWCFSPEGPLLSMTIRTEGRGPTILEADRVSSEVPDRAFVPPAA